MQFLNPMRELFDFLKMMISDDSGHPSSSRGIGLILFSCLSICVSAVTGVFLYKIVTVSDSQTVKVVTDALIRFTWIYVIMAATALSLYGIHVWKYIAQIRTGVALPEASKEKTEDESLDT